MNRAIEYNDFGRFLNKNSKEAGKDFYVEKPQQLEKMLENVSIIAEVSNETVGIGNTVSIKYVDDDEIEEYVIPVYTDEDEANEAIEKARLLLRENIDLKKLLEENGIDIKENLSKDTILYEE